MSLLVVPKPPPPPTTKSRQEVIAIVKAAPTGKRSLEWWQRWLSDHWA